MIRKSGAGRAGGVAASGADILCARWSGGRGCAWCAGGGKVGLGVGPVGCVP